MPDNSLGTSDHKPNAPRGTGTPNPEFGVIRTVDGRSRYESDHYYDGEHHYDRRNVHQPDVPDEFELGQVHPLVAGFFLCFLVVLLVALLTGRF